MNVEAVISSCVSVVALVLFLSTGIEFFSLLVKVSTVTTIAFGVTPLLLLLLPNRRCAEAEEEASSSAV